MEEKYADRTPGSPTQDQVVFPKTKSGEKAKAKYDSLIAERNELDEEIDWEQVEIDSESTADPKPGWLTR